VSGLVNVAGGDSKGAQVALVNFASHIVGTQVGLVNVSDRIDGWPIGLVNIEKDGVLQTELWTEDISSAMLGYAFGTRVAYTIASVGFGFGASPESPSASLGIGARLTLGPFSATWTSRGASSSATRVPSISRGPRAASRCASSRAIPRRAPAL
jgi:hypothetical protein